MKRRISVLCLLLALMMINIATVSAAETEVEAEKQYIKADIEQMCPEEIALRKELGMTDDTPQLLSTAITTGTTLTISSSGDAGCGGSVSGGDDIRTIQIFLYLQKNSDKSNVMTWMDIKDSYFFAMSRHHQLTEHGTYIVKMSAYVYTKDSNYENLVRYSHTDTY